MKRLFDDTRYNLVIGFRRFLRSHTINLSLLGLTKLILLCTGLASPYLFKWLIDEVLLKKDVSWLAWICIGFGMLFVLESVTHYVQLYYLNKYRMKFSFDLRTRLWKNIMKFDVLLQKRYSSGDLKNRLDTDVDRCEAFVEQQILNYGFYWLLAISNGVILLVTSWKLALFGFLMVPLSFWMVRWLGNGVKRSSEGFRKEWGGYEGWLQKTLGNWKEIKALGIEKQQSIAFTGYWKSLSKLFFKQQMYWYGNRSFIAFKDFFITRMNLYFLGGLLIFSDEMTVGSLIVFMKFYEQFFMGINNINNLDLELKKDFPALQRVLELLLPPKTTESNHAPEYFKGSIRFSNVSYVYDEITGEGVKEINLKISPGEKIAIVGKSGSGKSTLVHLLCGFYTAQSGTIYLDDVAIQAYDPRYIRKRIAMVMQDNYLFNLSIEENLRLANANATTAEIEEACNATNINNVVKDMKDGYKTVVGEKGVILSGGQKQRLMISRALLKKPTIFILDEATSQLDQNNEYLIQKTIEQISSEKTVIIIAHNFSSVKEADRIIVMENGRIVGDGMLTQLQENNKTFQELFCKGLVQKFCGDRYIDTFGEMY
ncbi:ABC transporter ATP-binding protein [Paenibacillus macerans]|uniref:ABC transporter family protein n=1 Tax=Paenibacillus macerans TaxID=44252 RepID=A0A090ZL88_PAEMA|nr:ABC transporter ATP-binding protein [Paenibacillus macerans]KFN11168.1 ABC transporter family protein [Paenibacillus macerans]MCY7560226.1 ABC transporter ATP-binding protein/permease [Paenibacillus macerans]MEC0151280.1 ABC transporter ATP-binding protein [Paenibacillus macerans]SUD26817.1 multidrug ABC transporter ATP-binding protein [Paenibacillus macerans]